MGARPHHRVLVRVRLCPGGGRERGRRGRAPGRLLRGLAGVPVGVVPAALRAAAVVAL